MNIREKIFVRIARSIIPLLPNLKLNKVKRFLLTLSGYKIERNVVLYSSSKIIGDINLTIGENTFIGHETLIMGGQSSISIGKNCDISSRVNIISGTHKISMEGRRSAGEGIGKDIYINDGVWIGFGAIILPGVTIGKKAIIGAGSVVNNDIPAYCIAVGNPCKPIKKWNSQLQFFESL